VSSGLLVKIRQISYTKNHRTTNPNAPFSIEISRRSRDHATTDINKITLAAICLNISIPCISYRVTTWWDDHLERQVRPKHMNTIIVHYADVLDSCASRLMFEHFEILYYIKGSTSIKWSLRTPASTAKCKYNNHALCRRTRFDHLNRVVNLFKGWWDHDFWEISVHV